jgi:hypothetical protein
VVYVETLLRTESGAFVEIQAATEVRGGRSLGRNHVEGCLVLQAEGKELLGPAEWTDVDWLWMFLLDGLEAMAAHRSFETAFPDMPIGLAFRIVERHGHRDLVKIEVSGLGPRSVSVARQDLLDAMVGSGLVFFENLARLVPARSGTAQVAISRLAKLERPNASSRIAHAQGELRVQNGICEAVLDYVIAHAVEIAPDVGERLLRADGGPALMPWRKPLGARVRVDQLSELSGGPEMLGRLLQVHAPTVSQVTDDETVRRSLTRVLSTLALALSAVSQPNPSRYR